MVNFKPARIALCIGMLAAAPVGVSTVAHAQDTDPAVAEYAGLLDQIQNVKVATMQRELMTARQADQIANLKSNLFH